jgi:hypothetical protein
VIDDRRSCAVRHSHVEPIRINFLSLRGFFADMEETMRGIGLRGHRKALWIAVAGCAIVVSVVVLATVSEHSTPTKARADIQRPMSLKPEAEVGPAAFEIAPSPVIEPNPKFFFGAGDGSSGYYDERPAR